MKLNPIISLRLGEVQGGWFFVRGYYSFQTGIDLDEIFNGNFLIFTTCLLRSILWKKLITIFRFSLQWGFTV